MKALFRRRTCRKQWDKSGSLSEIGNNYNTSNSAQEESQISTSLKKTLFHQSRKDINQLNSTDALSGKALLNNSNLLNENLFNKCKILVQAKTKNTRAFCDLKLAQMKYQEVLNNLSVEKARNENLVNILKQVQIVSDILSRQESLIREKAADFNANCLVIEQKLQ